ncbi:MAG: iron-sulfur cluster repair di-iron protein [Planctomycetota bacterium]|jgi:regulator of cell morphogenesis and NO signaling|nr:iron-sulfur cluster repair di-iron protein [Planctomycetota bacterium]MDP6941131.1 iron-sulfur cluster repair di-iron protein [Planctomycetota bacterium]
MDTLPTITPETTVGDIAAHLPLATGIFARHKMDYCCGGNRPLAEACERAGADMETVQREIAELERTDDGLNLLHAPLDQLCDHIESMHHTYLKEAMPALWEMMKKVLNAHSENHPEYVELHQTTGLLFNELHNHLQKEEEILFPMIRRLAGGEPANPDGPGCMTPEAPMQVMEAEHDNAGNALRRMRELTNDYTVPENACTTLTALIKGLEECESDIHRHIHKENNILHPRVREMLG